jgi:DNA adenine methylase
MITSPISWMGGKRQLRREILKRLPEHRVYVEPFCGAAWVFFGKERSDVEVLNDKSGELTNFWRCVRERPAELAEAVRWSLSSKADFLLERDADLSGLSEIQRAARFYFLVRLAYGSRMVGAGFGFSRHRRSRFDAGTLRESLERAHERIQRVWVLNDDVETVIERTDGTDTLFYCDPPYLLQGRYYEHEFSAADHERLAQTLRSVAGKFLLSYNDCEEIRDLYEGCNIEEVRLCYHTGRRKHGKAVVELLISNYDQQPTGNRDQ